MRLAFCASGVMIYASIAEKCVIVNIDNLCSSNSSGLLTPSILSPLTISITLPAFAYSSIVSLLESQLLKYRLQQLNIKNAARGKSNYARFVRKYNYHN